MPAWAERLLATGERPAEGAEGFDDYIGWLFFNDEIVGLPDPMSESGLQLWGERHAKVNADESRSGRSAYRQRRSRRGGSATGTS
jgi:hypothetical protein